MYVSNEVRRRELPEPSPDPSPYASAASGASFMAILSEVGRTPENNPAEKTEQAVEAPSETSSTAGTDKPGEKDSVTEESPVDSKDPTAEVAESETSPTDSSKTAGGSADDPAPPVVAAQSPSPVLTGPQEETPVTAPGLAMATAASLVDADTLLATENKETKATPGTVSDGETDAPSVLKSLLVDAGVTDGSVTADGEITPAKAETIQPIFPKTLNAMLAEGAVRQLAEPASSEGDSATAVAKLEALDSVEATVEPGSAEKTQDLPRSLTLPQATALEVGGVRPQAGASGLPRVPMANLPGELAQQIHLMQQEGAHSMRLRLVPENLGDIQIEIQGTGDRLQVRLISSNPAVRDALENQMSNLKDALQKQGLALDNATVDGGAAGRNAPRESERRPASTTYRAAATLSEPVGARIQTSAPLALGSSALNILA